MFEIDFRTIAMSFWQIGCSFAAASIFILTSPDAPVIKLGLIGLAYAIIGCGLAIAQTMKNKENKDLIFPSDSLLAKVK